MPEVEYTTRMRLPVSDVWTFVSDMNNWAPFLTGYQKHEVLDETDSIWTLKGDVGILSRIVELRAHVTEWVAPERVTFTLTGLNEAVEDLANKIAAHLERTQGSP
jgi:carbon monoxide dehydrogenase subunit G